MEEGAVGVLQRKGKGGHLKKRALKNKALGVTFNEKDLQDYVGGFHKRKKKRRKEAQKQQEEVLRRKRSEERKKRKLEREFVMYGGVAPTADSRPDEIDECQEEEVESTSGTKTYENADLKVTVVTSEINPEEESYPSERKMAAVSPLSVVADKRHNVPVNNKNLLKRLQNTSHGQSQEVREIKRKGRSRERSNGSWALKSTSNCILVEVIIEFSNLSTEKGELMLAYCKVWACFIVI
ncbi:LOW QUALITY PROTEIN: ribosomal RNA-processing protein 17 [Gastrolobium bilobum]|uniref:LOW QUALITY PROTEIN: ribosomal RNA-processing protein 17 n=1 Tax=Gastrolobium bilobum TaxID=150636 RepID=UPI002AB0E203|nr:LOW QUALITY PROTEIN: ribosomal RNA-processing protein 17 [Gastrolobium bilobum]